MIQISLIGNEVRKTDNWFNEVYNESGKVGDYKGTPVYTIEEIKFEPKRANRNFIYQGTSENLNLIFWDGSVMQQVVMTSLFLWKDRSRERRRLVS